MDNVMVIGSGGREHALARSISNSPEVRELFAFPGSDAIALEPKCKVFPGDIKPEDYNTLADRAKELGVVLAIFGPEKPLIDGAADLFRKRGIKTFGTTMTGAQLEGSKAYAKGFMADYGVPTADFETFRRPEQALDYVKILTHPVVVKASGPALGKGVLFGKTREEAEVSVRRIMLDKEFGDAGSQIVIEKYLPGEEASCMVFVNSSSGILLPLPFSADHKRLLDGDNGENTGGMGAYAPTGLVTNEMAQKIFFDILARTLNGMQKEEIDYVGPLYPGLMITDGSPRVLEYNVRMGDPETQAVLPLVKDIYTPVMDVVDGRRSTIKTRPGYAVCVVLASEGYGIRNTKIRTGVPISGLAKNGQLEMDDVTVFHAATRLESDIFYTKGGRVLGVTGYGETFEKARSRTYDAVSRIHFDGMHFRRDIGLREANRK